MARARNTYDEYVDFIVSEMLEVAKYLPTERGALSIALERNINTQIPIEDQIPEW